MLWENNNNNIPLKLSDLQLPFYFTCNFVSQELGKSLVGKFLSGPCDITCDSWGTGCIFKMASSLACLVFQCSLVSPSPHDFSSFRAKLYDLSFLQYDVLRLYHWLHGISLLRGRKQNLPGKIRSVPGTIQLYFCNHFYLLGNSHSPPCSMK